MKFSEFPKIPMRNGREATIYCMDAPGIYPIQGWYDHVTECWKSDGSYMENDDGSECDLVLPPAASEGTK